MITSLSEVSKMWTRQTHSVRAESSQLQFTPNKPKHTSDIRDQATLIHAGYMDPRDAIIISRTSKSRRAIIQLSEVLLKI